MTTAHNLQRRRVSFEVELRPEVLAWLKLPHDDIDAKLQAVAQLSTNEKNPSCTFFFAPPASQKAEQALMHEDLCNTGV